MLVGSGSLLYFSVRLRFIYLVVAFLLYIIGYFKDYFGDEASTSTQSVDFYGFCFQLSPCFCNKSQYQLTCPQQSSFPLYFVPIIMKSISLSLSALDYVHF